MNKKIILLTALILLGIAAYFFVIPGDEQNVNESNYPFVSVQRKNMSQSVIATGIIKPKVGAEVKVGAQVSGIVKDLYVEVGSKVKKNELLAIIDAGIYKAKADQVNAIKELAEIEKSYAQIELTRSESLHKKKVISDQELEAASQRYELACARLKQAEADYDYAALQLSYTQITSPINGVVASISTQKGETVAASFAAPTFVTIIDLNRLELWAYIDETDIGRVKTGQKVSFTVDTYPGDFFEGVVERIYPKADTENNVVNYITVIKIIAPAGQRLSGNGEVDNSSVMENNSKTLRPEMTSTIEVFTSLKNDVLVLPKKAVRIEEGKTYVNILENGKLKKKYIKVGINNKKYYEILSGLSGNEKVILNDPSQLENNMEFE